MEGKKFQAPASSYGGFISRSTKSFEISSRLFALSSNPGELEHQKKYLKTTFITKTENDTLLVSKACWNVCFCFLLLSCGPNAWRHNEKPMAILERFCEMSMKPFSYFPGKNQNPDRIVIADREYTLSQFGESANGIDARVRRSCFSTREKKA